MERNVYSFAQGVGVNAHSSETWQCDLRNMLRRMQINSITFTDYVTNLHLPNNYQLPDNNSMNSAWLQVGAAASTYTLSRQFFNHFVSGVPVAAPNGNGQLFTLAVGQYIFNSFFVEESLQFLITMNNDDINANYQHNISLIVETTEGL